MSEREAWEVAFARAEPELQALFEADWSQKSLQTHNELVYRRRVWRDGYTAALAASAAPSVGELREAKMAMFGEVCMALLSDRETSRLRDEWAPVMKRLQDKYALPAPPLPDTGEL